MFLTGRPLNKTFITLKGMREFLILWLTQAFSGLGSAMTMFALVVWSYQAEGSALSTAMLTICSYAPYVVMSIFAGALSDRWNKKTTMLICDAFSALTSVIVLILLQNGILEIWHLYGLNALNGLMNSIQQPAVDVTTSLMIKPDFYQTASGLRSFSNSLNGVLSPMIATALMTLLGLQVVIWFDLATFLIAFVVLFFFIRIPEVPLREEEKTGVFESAISGLKYLKANRGILHLICFLAAINLTASMYDAGIPALMISREGGGEVVYGIFSTVTGITTLFGSLLAAVLPAPKSRVRLICDALLISMSTENFILAFGRTLPLWCLGTILGWLPIPLMSANMDVLMRTHVPIEMQGRVYAARNTLQYFTIPIGFFLAGFLIDNIFEPFMAAQGAESFFHQLFGFGKGSGAAILFLLIAVLGTLTCLVFRCSRSLWSLDKTEACTTGESGV